MAFHVFLFLLVVCLIRSSAVLWRPCWLPLRPSHSPAGSRHTLLHRLLRPRTPLDCPLCRLSSSDMRPIPAPVRPWSEVKSRRGAPKRVNTEGFACPNQQCPYFGITDAQVHALVGDGKHGHAERIQTFRCQACHTTFCRVSICRTPLPVKSLTKSYRPRLTEAQSNFVRPGSSEMQLSWRTKTVVGGETHIPTPSSSFSLIACEAVSEAVGTFFRPKHRPRAEAVQEGVAFATLVLLRLPL